MHPIYGALPVPNVPVRITGGAVIAHRYNYAPPRCRTSQHRRIFIRLLVCPWNDLGDRVFDGVGLAGFNSRANVFLFALVAPFLLCNVLPFGSFILYVGIVGLGCME